ncbi:MAG: dihydrodipicolinate synthase family protein, partial [Verrucomicrobiae bacterium]|nr:dihydrodipicolinate synthase family protein [Verrucomicrobiae bacterium]NNJ86832.1 N-acetylneuraminate lyase [Akkermansiaceae bacterium]
NMDEARIWQQRAMKMIDTIFATCGRAGLKAMWEMVGVDCGPVRAPLSKARPEQIAELRKRLEAIGYFDWCASKLQLAV